MALATVGGANVNRRPIKQAVKAKVPAKRELPQHESLSPVGKRIEALLKERDMSQRELARRVGIRQQSINYLMRGRNGVAPKSRYTARIADVLSVDPLWLETGLGDRRGSGVISSEGSRIGRRIPIMDVESLTGSSSSSPKETTADTTEEGAFAFDVTDAAMEPDVLRGDRLIIAPKKAPRPGNLVLANVDGSVELRRFRVQGTGKAARFELIAKHPDYPTFNSEANKCLLIGVVIEQRRFIVAG